MQSFLTWSYLQKVNYVGCPWQNQWKQHTPQHLNITKLLCLPQKNTEPSLSSWDSHVIWTTKKKSVLLFQKLNYYTTALGMWSDHWHFIYKKIKAGRTPQLSVFVHDSLYGKNFISAKCCEDLWKLLELLSKMTLDFKWSLFHLNNTVVLLQLTRNSLQSYNTVTSFL